VKDSLNVVDGFDHFDIQVDLRPHDMALSFLGFGIRLIAFRFPH
jgi:hypothetical protein